MKVGKYVEFNGFTVEVEEGGSLIVSDETGEMHDVGDANDNNHAADLIEDAIRDFSYGIAQELVRRLNS